MKEDVREPVCGVAGTMGQDRLTGPLGPLEGRVRAALGGEGFTPGSIRCVTGTMRRLSCWMEQRGMTADALTAAAAGEFVADSGEMRTARRGLGTLLRVLRSQGLVPPERDSAGDTAAGRLLAQYRDYLAGERGLAAESVRCYLVQGRKLVDELGEPLEESLRQLDAAAVTSFIMRQSRQAASTWSAKTLVTATRSLLRFLHVKGLITAPLAGAVPAVAGWRLSALPRGLGGQPEDPLFPSRRGTRLSRDAVARLVAVHAENAARACPSIAGKHVTPHTLRHSTAMALLRAGVDTSVIALWLGHESPETTQAYLHADMEIKNRALARVNPPGGTPGRYSPPDSLIAYLKTL